MLPPLSYILIFTRNIVIDKKKIGDGYVIAEHTVERVFDTRMVKFQVNTTTGELFKSKENDFYETNWL